VHRLVWPSRNQPDQEGFTLVELLIAMVVITTGLLVLAATMYSAFNSIGFSRQRDVATGLANQAMEQIKALSFNNLEMLQSDIQSDTSVSCSGSPLVCKFQGRTIPMVTSLTGSALQLPLYPHVSTSTPAVGKSNPGPSTFTISSYVTFDPSGNTQARDATVEVTWNHPVSGGASDLVQIESTIFSTGALPTGTGGHVWNAQAVDNPGTVSISASTFLTGNLAALSFGPGSTSASISGDGSATASGNVAPSTLQILNQTLLHTNSASSTASSSAGQGVSAPAANTVSNSGTLQTNSILDLLDSGFLTVTGGAGVTATTQAVAASSANGSANLSGGVMPNSSLPYAQGLAEQSGPISLGLDTALLNVLGLQIGSSVTNLLNITPLGNSNPDLSTVCEQSTSGAGCQNAMPGTGNTTGVSQSLPAGPAVVAQAQKSYASIQVLPGLASPLLDIEGFTAAASAQAGPSVTNSGKANLTAGTVKILGVSQSLTNLLNGVTSGLQFVTTAIGTLGVQVSLKLGAASTSGNTAIVGSPLTIGISLSLGSLITIIVTVNLGSVSASASYS
jgi:prepilin-type N-terminal cleavage/methylation domain-containing protein